MPFAYDLLDEEEQKKQDQAQGGDQAAPAMTGGGESFGGEGGGAQAPQQSNGEKGTSKQGSGFVNLDKYMTANQGNNFGDQVTGKVQGDVDQAKQTLTDTSAGFTDASNQGTTRWNDAEGTVKGVVDSAGDNTSKDDVSKVQGYAKAQYQGPDNFLGSAYGTQAQGAIQKGTQEANALQSEGGRFALLDQFYGRPKYSMGEKSLDNLLVQNAPGVSAKSQSIGNQAKQLTTTADQTTQGLDNLATGNKFATQDVAKQTRDYLGKAVTGFESDLERRYKGYTDANDSYNKSRRDDLSDDAFDADTLAMLGLGEGDNLYDANLSNYLTDNAQGNVGEFATDQDYAKYLALQQLAGEDPTLLNADDRAKAGTAAAGRVTFDKDRLSKDISQRQTQYNTEMSDYINQNQMLKQAQDYLATEGQAGGAVVRTAEQYQQVRDWLANELAPFKKDLDAKYNVNRKVSKA